MKKLQFLKTLLDLVWLSSIAGVLLLTAFTVYLFINGHTDIPVKMNCENVTISDNATKS